MSLSPIKALEIIKECIPDDVLHAVLESLERLEELIQHTWCKRCDSRFYIETGVCNCGRDLYCKYCENWYPHNDLRCTSCGEMIR